MKQVRHPAVYSTALLPVMSQYLKKKDVVLDMFAGTGKIARIREFGFKGEIICNELEKDFAIGSPYYGEVDRWIFGDACRVPLEDNSIPAIATSPCYGNRMADSGLPEPGGYQRATYTHGLGKKLKEGNAGVLQWGRAYQELHRKAWKEALRLLEAKGLLIVNVSNHIRNFEEVNVVAWHRRTIEKLGFTMVAHEKIKTPRYGYGQNGQLRVDSESVLVFRK